MITLIGFAGYSWAVPSEDPAGIRLTVAKTTANIFNP
jgi:hypothetical protein